jgi:phosphatidate cytidylyltransferase
MESGSAVLEHKQTSFLKTLAIRIFSILVLLPIALSAMWFGGIYFQLMIAAIAGFVSYEWFRIITKYQPIERKLVGFIAFFQSIAFTGALYFYASQHYLISVIFALIFIFAVLLISKRSSGSLLFWWIMGAAVIAIPAYALLWLRDIQDFGREVTFFLFFAIWMTDSIAFLGGNFFKGPKLAPKISPGKTWSGTITGMLAGIGIGALAPLTLGIENLGGISLKFMVLGGCISILCQISDLAESWLKRRFDVKDSGNLIPGHGGFLDRVDSLFLTAPFMAMVMLFFGLQYWSFHS